MTVIDAVLAVLEPMLGGWVLVFLACAFVLCVYALWTLVMDYAQRAAMSLEMRKVAAERDREQRERDRLQAISRIMESTAKYRNVN